MPTPEDYMEMMQQAEVLMEGGKRQIEIASLIQEKVRELLESVPESEMKKMDSDSEDDSDESGDEEEGDGDNRRVKKLNIIAIMKRKKK